MHKRIAAVLLILILLAALVPAPVRAAPNPAEPAGTVRNSDAEASAEGVCWLVDTMDGNRLAVARTDAAPVCCMDDVQEGPELTRFTDWAADQLLFWEGRLLVSAGTELRILDPDTAAILETRRFEAPVDRFAVSDAGLYVLTGGRVLFFARGSGEAAVVVDGAARFWLEGSDALCYMEDEATVHSLCLSTGAVTDRPNQASDLEDRDAQGGDEPAGLGLSALREKFPHGKYWNHMPNRGTGPAYNNQNGWTNLACPKHNDYCGTSRQTCNGYAPNGVEITHQCWGFADKLGYDASGCDPEKYDSGNGWRKLCTASCLSSLKAGDIIRYHKTGTSIYHSIYVTAVSGDTITYADCNYNGTCVIRWGQTISKSTIRAGFVFVMTAPSAVGSGGGSGGGSGSDGTPWLFNVNACLDGEDAVNTVDYAIFDYYYKDKLVKADATDFRGWREDNSSYEIRNVRPVEGVLFDEAASGPLSGTLTEDTVLILVLDHYYLNSAGEPVKTKLKDLPKQNKWSYQPICWALENSIASGLSETRFGPGKACTRGQIVTFLWAAAGRPEPETTELPFTDVKASSYCFKPICWALENGVASGLSETRFGPGETCTRGQAVTFLWAAAGSPEPTCDDCPFKDVKKSSFFGKAVLWALENGITGGTSETTFSPKKACTRAEILTFLYKASLLGPVQESDEPEWRNHE